MKSNERPNALRMFGAITTSRATVQNTKIVPVAPMSVPNDARRGDTLAAEEADPAHLVRPNSCLLTTQYNRIAERLMFQHDHRPWPEQLR